MIAAAGASGLGLAWAAQSCGYLRAPEERDSSSGEASVANGQLMQRGAEGGQTDFMSSHSMLYKTFRSKRFLVFNM